jgi:GTPase Era involved in 16S rRNA processing
MSTLDKLVAPTDKGSMSTRGNKVKVVDNSSQATEVISPVVNQVSKVKVSKILVPNKKDLANSQKDVLKKKKALAQQTFENESKKAQISSKEKEENFNAVEAMVRMAYCLGQPYPFSSSSFIQVTYIHQKLNVLRHMIYYNCFYSDAFRCERLCN